MGKRSRRVARGQQDRINAAHFEPAPDEFQPRPSAGDRRLDLYLYLALFVVTLAVYSQVTHFEFVNYDDPDYVTDNTHVRAGLTWAGVVWAFTSYHAANWSPLTWISHMADVEWFGMRSGWHHWTNVLLHSLATIFLFAALKRMTGARWPSAFVAFLFALHPLHVESVAWVAERKDVLCALCWFVALWRYARYVEKPGGVRYSLVLLAFGLGLMAKPMIVTLPFVLLLLDVWPLRRANRLAVLWEKLPLFVLAAAASFVTYLAQQQGGAVRSLDTTSLALRLGNALVTYVTYIARMLWPASLAVFYPYPHPLAGWRVLLAVVALTGVTVVVVRLARSHPYLAVGWLWYLGTLVPVIGIIQVGGQSSADRYTYVPMVGLAIMLSWAAVDLVRRFPEAKTGVVASAAVVCAACVILTSLQLRFWVNSESLFQHAVNVTIDNHIAHNNLASYYLTQSRNEEALSHIDEALRIKPSYPEAHVNLATVLRRLGKNDESERQYQAAIALQPASVQAHSGYGALLVAEARMPDAVREFQQAVVLDPEYADGHYSLGRVLAAVGRSDEAIAEFGEAVRLRPDHADARRSLGMALLSRGRFADALAMYAAAVKLTPADARGHYDLGTLLASAGRLDEAITQFSEAVRINPQFDAARQRRDAAIAQRDRARSR